MDKNTNQLVNDLVNYIQNETGISSLKMLYQRGDCGSFSLQFLQLSYSHNQMLLTSFILLLVAMLHVCQRTLKLKRNIRNHKLKNNA